MLSSMFLNVTTLLPVFCPASRGGKICCSIFFTLLPSAVENPSKIRCGKDSDTVPRTAFGISPRRITFEREKEAVGPWGKWLMVSAVGTPRCSWRRIASERSAAFALSMIAGKMRFPRLSLIEVGKRSLISLENVDRRELGSLDVDMRILGSRTWWEWLAIY